MALDAVLERFVKGSPVGVMARLTLQQAISPQWLNELFEENRERQYTRELLFSTTVDLMSVVAMGLQPSLHAAVQASDLNVSITALYDKVNHTEPGVVRALVQGSGARLTPLMTPMKKGEAPWAKGYRVRIVDGNHIASSEKRLQLLRHFPGAALPGHSLVVYAPEQGLVVDMVPCEDAHRQERTLMPAVLQLAQPGDLWISDRNFSTRAILFGFERQQATFIVREHGSSPNPHPLGSLRKVGRIETGTVYEQPVQIVDEAGQLLDLRRIELHLDVPTEEGDSIICLLTNAPKSRLTAKAVARLYRKRWTIEGMFQRLEGVLHSEVRTLGRPRAALFAFGVALVAYNILAVLQAAIEAAHPEAKEAGIELSAYYVSHAVKLVYAGMMMAVAPAVWSLFEQSFSAQELGHLLIDIAAYAEPRRFRKHPRGPKKKVKKKAYVQPQVARRHISTARAIDSGTVDYRRPTQ
jgi:IS4 transposase